MAPNICRFVIPPTATPPQDLQTPLSNHECLCPKWVYEPVSQSGPRGVHSPGSHCSKMAKLAAITMETTVPLQFPPQFFQVTWGWCVEESPGCHDDGPRI